LHYFSPKVLDQNQTDLVEEVLAAKMHKAMAVIMFKLEGQLIKKHPEYNMDDRILLEKVDFSKGCVEVEGKIYELRDKNFPTVNPKDPLKLSVEEQELMKTITCSVKNSKALHSHVRFIYAHGSTYKCVNSNLLYHGCVSNG
jgi:fructose-1,6-bisphosphatase-3